MRPWKTSKFNKKQLNLLNFCFISLDRTEISKKNGRIKLISVKFNCFERNLDVFCLCPGKSGEICPVKVTDVNFLLYITKYRLQPIFFANGNEFFRPVSFQFFPFRFSLMSGLGQLVQFFPGEAGNF